MSTLRVSADHGFGAVEGLRWLDLGDPNLAERLGISDG